MYCSSSNARNSRWASPGSAASRSAVLSPHPSDACGNAIRPSRWSQSAWVTSSPDTGKPACSSTLGTASSSSGYTGESITKPSSPARTAVHVVCQKRLITTITSALTATTFIARGAGPYEMPRSFTASRRLATSASGFFWLDSSVSLSRLTQITGILRLMHGSTS